MSSQSNFNFCLHRARWLRWVMPLVVMVGAGTSPCLAGKAKPVVNQEERNAGFRRLFGAAFARWDLNHDGKLDENEIIAAIDDSQISGNESAIAVVLRRKLLPGEDGKEKSLALQQVLALAADKGVQQTISRHAWHIASINHAVFAPDDPKLTTFHQGGIGDCYLLAVIGAYTFHHPQELRSMITPQADGSLDVQFASGKKVTVSPITDAELVLGASEGKNHGVWLSVLEKAFARMREQERHKGKDSPLAETVATDLIGHGGYYDPVISLFSGHRTADPPLGRWLKENPQIAQEKLHNLLTKLSAEQRLMATGTRGDKKLPKGIPHGHVFAVLRYNPTTRMVLMFNPWGNHVKPSDPPGLVNGYRTEHGMFEIPLADFFEVFGGLAYETDKPVKG